MNHVVSFSSGMSSAITASRVLARYGKENVTVVFMDTLFEDNDNYRFMSDWKNHFGVEIVTLSDGRNPYEVAEDKPIIPNSLIAPCTFALKIDLFRKWLSVRQLPITIHIGYDFSEFHRVEATKNSYEKLGYKVDFPLMWDPVEERPYEEVVRNDWGIEPPRMYKLGYKHANCGGRCCKQGQGEWIRTLKNFPERFAEMETWEEKMRKNIKYKDHAILRKERNGERFPLPLKELRETYQNKMVDESLLNELDAGTPCVVCGIA